MEDLVLRNEDWAGIPTPVLISRNLTFEGDPGVLPNPKILNMNWVAGKMRLEHGVVLTFRYLVIINYRLGNHNQAPGVDILVPCLPNTSAVVLAMDSLGVHRACYPPSVQKTSLANIPRPSAVPGNQTYRDNLPQLGCVADPSAPPLLRCWPHRGAYDDLAMPGADLSDLNLLMPTRYYVHMVRVIYLCNVLLEDDCVARLGPLGCATYTYARMDPPWPSTTSSSNLSRQQQLPLLDAERSWQGGDGARAATDGGGGGGGRSPGEVAAIVGGIVGGFALVGVLVGALVFFARRRQRRRNPSGAGGVSGRRAPGASRGAPGKRVDGDGGDCALIIPLSASVELLSVSVSNGPGAVDPPTAPDSGSFQQEPPSHPDSAQAVALPSPELKLELGPGPRARPLGRPGGSVNSVDGGSSFESCASSQGYGSVEEVVDGAVAAAAASVTTTVPAGADAAAAEPRVLPPHAPTARHLRGAPVGADSLAVVTHATPHRPDLNLALVFMVGRPSDPGMPASAAGAASGGSRRSGGDGGGGDGDGGDGDGGVASAVVASRGTLPASRSENGIAQGVAGAGGGDKGGGGGGGGCAAVWATGGGGGGGGGDFGGELALLPNAKRGRGSYGKVVEGMYRGERVAVKLMADLTGPAVSVDSLARSFAQEVEVLGRCQHPNVVRLLAACLTPPRLCLVMELMDTTLDSMIRRAPGCLLPMDTVLSICLDIARGLEYLHPTIMHRDLKPANVLVKDPLGPCQVAKLSDFGLSRLRSSVLLTKNPEAGTPSYMAPECFDSCVTAITHHVDIYALGVVLWVMLSGKEPWPGLNMVRLAYLVTYAGKRPPLAAIPPGRRPLKLLRLIEACWDTDPMRRPAAAEILKVVLLVREMVQQEQHQHQLLQPQEEEEEQLGRRDELQEAEDQPQQQAQPAQQQQQQQQQQQPGRRQQRVDQAGKEQQQQQQPVQQAQVPSQLRNQLQHQQAAAEPHLPLPLPFMGERCLMKATGAMGTYTGWPLPPPPPPNPTAAAVATSAVAPPVLPLQSLDGGGGAGALTVVAVAATAAPGPSCGSSGGTGVGVEAGIPPSSADMSNSPSHVTWQSTLSWCRGGSLPEGQAGTIEGCDGDSRGSPGAAAASTVTLGRT